MMGTFRISGTLTGPDVNHPGRVDYLGVAIVSRPLATSGRNSPNAEMLGKPVLLGEPIGRCALILGIVVACP
jgi:hypothetical protein